MKPTDTVIGIPVFVYDKKDLPKIIHIFEEACKIEMVIKYLKKGGDNHAIDN